MSLIQARTRAFLNCAMALLFGISIVIGCAPHSAQAAAPVLSGIEAAPLPYHDTDPLVSVTTALQVFDADSPNLASATVQITGNYQNGLDILSFVQNMKEE